jgi:hypothetical protein
VIYCALCVGSCLKMVIGCNVASVPYDPCLDVLPLQLDALCLVDSQRYKSSGRSH